MESGGGGASLTVHACEHPGKRRRNDGGPVNGFFTMNQNVIALPDHLYRLIGCVRELQASIALVHGVHEDVLHLLRVRERPLVHTRSLDHKPDVAVVIPENWVLNDAPLGEDYVAARSH